MVEFAITMPMALLMVLFGLDFGRVFLGWVSLHQAAREAANYAAMNPEAWTSPFNVAVQTEYARLVETEASSINCTLVTPVPAPSFPSGTSIGAPAKVELLCQFDLITPFIGILTGNPIPVSASSAFPVRSGLIQDIPEPTDAPSGDPQDTYVPTEAPTVVPTSTALASVAPSTAPSATPAPTPTAVPLCKVVSLIDVMASRAAVRWKNWNFTGAVIFSPLVPPNYKIAWQSLTVGTWVPCTSGITVRSTAP